MEDFYEINTEILKQIKSARGGRLTTNRTWSKLAYHKYGIGDISIIVFKDKLMVDTKATNLLIAESYLKNQYCYCEEKDLYGFSDEQIQEYRDKTFRFFAELLEYWKLIPDVMENCNWDYDYKELISDYVNEHPVNQMDPSEWINNVGNFFGDEYSGGFGYKNYYINSFITYPISYMEDIDGRIDILKDLIEIIPMEKEELEEFPPTTPIPAKIKNKYIKYNKNTKQSQSQPE